MVNATLATPETTSPQSPLSEVVDHVVALHHGYLRRELPRLRRLVVQAIDEAQTGREELQELAHVFERFASAMQMHIQREEQVTFPLIRQLDFAVRRHSSYAGGLEQSVSELCHEHAEARHALQLMRDLTTAYTYPTGCTDTLRQLYRGLAALDADMNRHMDIEEQVLFPRALVAEQGLRSVEFELHPFPPEVG